MKHLGIDQSAIRKAGALMMEKLSRTKLGLGGSGDPNLALLQSLETLALGITGKRSLWGRLAAAGENSRQQRMVTIGLDPKNYVFKGAIIGRILVRCC